MSTEKAKLFKTARARIACASFPANCFVAIRHYWTDEKGEQWFTIDRTQYGPCVEVAYPQHHLTDFCL